MTDLQTASEEQLRQELERRQRAPGPPPEPSDNPDFSALVEMVVRGVRESAASGYEDDDFKERLNQRLDEAQAAIDSQAYFVPLWLDPTTLKLLRDLLSLATDQPAKPAQAE